jgi:hypothetical protein
MKRRFSTGSLPPDLYHHIRADFAAEGTTGALPLGALLCGIKPLAIGGSADDDQLLRANRDTQTASLASLAVHLDFSHFS